jgi:tRNA threonylcarbamoyladenosine biosynthesis protein TsaB
MNGLAIDTTSEACSVALQDHKGSVLQRFAHAPRQHGELLLGWIEQLLHESGLRPGQLDAIWVSQGPGSFTSLRMGFAVATSMAFALDIPVVPVSSLLALAARAIADEDACEDAASRPEALVLATLDARLGEIYAAWYRCDQVSAKPVLQGAEQLLPPAQLQWPQMIAAQQVIALGNGLLVDEDCLLRQLAARGDRSHPDCWPQARDLFALAAIESGQAAWQVQLPYLRQQVADKPRQDT